MEVKDGHPIVGDHQQAVTRQIGLGIVAEVN
jgi:hypothetical protein